MNTKVLLPILAAAAMAAATPALAQSHHGWNDGGIAQRQAQLEQRVDRLSRTGQITRAEYNHFQRLFQHVDRLERDYRRGGLNQWERRELNAQLDRIQNQIRVERADNRRDNRWDSRDDRRGPHRNDRRW